MPTSRVYILGGAQTDFSIKYSKQQLDIGDIMAESFTKAKEEIKVSYDDIDAIHVGNFVGVLFCNQGLLGGVLAEKIPQLSGKPSMRHEAACASGSMAILAGSRDILSGTYDLVAVSGVEMMRNVDGTIASAHLGAAAYQNNEAQDAQYVWVSLFSDIRNFYEERYGVKSEHLAEISRINYDNAKRNPHAQTRDWEIGEDYFSDAIEYNPIVEGSLRKSDCARITDGAATLFLASASYAKQYANKHGLSLDSLPYIKGWGHSTASIQLQTKLIQAKEDKVHYPFPHLHSTIQHALKGAGLSSANELDAIETHDCFTISEYIAIEHFGLAAPGEAWKKIEDGTISMKGSLPINPSGGLIGSGHPVGATGVRMMLDAYKQVAQSADTYQVDDAKSVGILNIGGSFTTVASFIIGT